MLFVHDCLHPRGRLQESPCSVGNGVHHLPKTFTVNQKWMAPGRNSKLSVILLNEMLCCCGDSRARINETAEGKWCPVFSKWMQYRIYMDYNATTPLEAEVVQTVSEALQEAWGNPSSSYPAGKKSWDQSKSEIHSGLSYPTTVTPGFHWMHPSVRPLGISTGCVWTGKVGWKKN